MTVEIPYSNESEAEWFETVDENDVVIGRALRSECHGNPRLIHRTAHVVVFSQDGRLLLQKRAANKDIQPGKWDTAVGGHLAPGETYEQAARRETAEELGIPVHGLAFERIFDLRIRNPIESENVRVFKITCDGPFDPPVAEIDELRFWSTAELRAALGRGIFTPNLEVELKRLTKAGLLGNP
jgi:isopentenyl-diphosphate delta-isomerase type 1